MRGFVCQANLKLKLRAAKKNADAAFLLKELN